ncbi:MAG: PilZ domain-containing protein [Candidatus Omnitrophota bacterium]
MRERRKYKRNGPADRRKHPRSNGLVVINYTIPEFEFGGKSSAFDVSATGVRIIVEKKLKIATVVEMEIYLPGDSQAIPTIGEVVWSRPLKETPAHAAIAEHVKELYYASIIFTVIAQKNRQRVSEYIERKITVHEPKPPH